MNHTIQIYINRLLHLFEVRRVNKKGKTVFLTFDDGPEPQITEFILTELAKYGAKATFFCRGDNAEKYPLLLNQIVDEGHQIGNHTYNHINSFFSNTGDYIRNVRKADSVLNTNLFRPPWGSLSFSAFCKLTKKYKIVYWSLSSGDSELDKFSKEISLRILKNKTRPGDVILFHCCQRHMNETIQVLPEYLRWLSINGYNSEIIT